MRGQVTLWEFIESNGWPNAWVEHPEFDGLYVRKGNHIIEGELLNTLDLANLTAKTPGKGAFGRLIVELTVKYPTMHLYVENVMNPRFETKLLRMGFKRAPLEKCYYIRRQMTIKELRRIYLDYVLSVDWKANTQQIKDLQKFDEDDGHLPRTNAFLGALAQVVRKYCRPNQADNMYDSALEAWFEPEEECRK